MIRISPRFISSPIVAWTCALLSVLSASAPLPAETCRAADDGAIGCGETVSGAITPKGDTDSYTFDVAAGGVVNIRIVSHDFLNQMCFRVFDPAAGQIGSQQCGDGNYTVGPGTHTILVESPSGQGTGGYGLSLQGLSAAISCGPAMGCGQPVGAGIDCKGDTDALTFLAEAGDDISLRIAPATTMCYRLFDPTGVPVGAQQCDVSSMSLASGGLHTLLVVPNSPNSTGSYGITRHGLAGSDTCAAPIACGTTVSGRIDAVGDVEAYTFDGATAGGVTIRIGPASIIAPMCFRLYDPSGAPMGGRSCDFQSYLVGAGRHTLLVEPSSSPNTGGYGFTLEATSETLQCGLVIGCGQTAQGPIEQLGDTDAFVFEGQPGDTVGIGIHGSLVLQMCYRLFAPSGTAMGGRQCNMSTQWTLTSSGLHSIVVEPLNISGTGDYTLDLQCVACGDPDQDGVCIQADNCPGTANPAQTDTDGDGYGDACDCAPGDLGAYGWPLEVPAIDLAADTVTLSWSAVNAAAGPGTMSDLLRGPIGDLPVGSAARETCLGYGLGGWGGTDADMPPAGAGFWYLVRDRNTCGAGPWGEDGSGSPRTSLACP